jgi:hypothetical protein
MHDRKVTPEMASTIKLARQKQVPYSWISGYYPGLNFGRIADVMQGRLFPDVPERHHPSLPQELPVGVVVRIARPITSAIPGGLLSPRASIRSRRPALRLRSISPADRASTRKAAS